MTIKPIQVKNKGSLHIEVFELIYANQNKPPIDLIPFTTQLNIYESIFEPCISATAALDDSRPLIDYDILAGSKVKIKYKTFEDIDYTEMNFIIDGVSSAIPGTRTQIYFITMFSEESKRAVGLRVGEIYNKTSPENMINDILKNKIRTKKKFYFSRTGALDTMNCSNLYPFQAIDAIKKRSVSRSYTSSTYMFFENQDGYNFITLEEILDKAAKNPNITSGDMVFYYDIAEPNDVTQSSWRKIEVLEKSKLQSLIDTIQFGGVKSKIIAYDINTGQHYEFIYDDEKNDFKISARSVSYEKSITQAIYQKGDETNNLIVAPINSENDLLRIKKELLSKAYMTKLSSNVIRMEINGDSRITVGNAAQLNIPKINGGTAYETNEISSGIYLFAKIRHIISPSDLYYQQSCEMIKAGFY